MLDVSTIVCKNIWHKAISNLLHLCLWHYLEMATSVLLIDEKGLVLPSCVSRSYRSRSQPFLQLSQSYAKI